MHSENSRGVSLPEWMAENNAEKYWKAETRTGGTKFLGKSIREMKRALAGGLLTEVYASRDGLLQRMNPRLKLLVGLLLLVLISLNRNFYGFAGDWLLTIWLMHASGLPTFKLQKRIWGFMPLVTLIISLPAMFNFVIAGTPLLVIHHGDAVKTWLGITWPADIYISQQGFRAGMILFIRVGLSISCGVLIAMTTPMASLFKSLRVLGLPSIMVMVTEMCYRYLVLTLNLSIEMFEARCLRTVGVMSMASKRAQVGSSISALFARSVSLADEVYAAMVARGYTGQAVFWEGNLTDE